MNIKTASKRAVYEVLPTDCFMLFRITATITLASNAATTPNQSCLISFVRLFFSRRVKIIPTIRHASDSHEKQ